jgi:hypothetical protein
VWGGNECPEATWVEAAQELLAVIDEAATQTIDASFDIFGGRFGGGVATMTSLDGDTPFTISLEVLRALAEAWLTHLSARRG